MTEPIHLDESQVLALTAPQRQRSPLAQLTGAGTLAEDEAFSLRRYARMLLRRKWLAIAVAVTVIVLAAVDLFTTTPLYRATATLQIDREFSRDMPFSEIGEARLPSGTYLLTQISKLRSRSLAERVVRELELADDPAFSQPIKQGFFRDQPGALKDWLKELSSARSRARDQPTGAAAGAAPALVGRLLSGLEATPVATTQLMKVSFKSPDPGVAARVANGMAEEFIKQNLESKYESIRKVMQFLERELSGLGSKIAKSEAESLRYAREQNLITLSERQELQQSRLSRLIDARTGVETELVAQRMRYEVARDSRSFLGLEDDSLRGIESQLGAVRSELASASSQFGPEWPTVKELRLELEALERRMNAAKQEVLERAARQYELLLRRRDEYSTAIEEQRKLVEEINDELLQYDMLQRGVDANKELYEGLLEKLSQASVAAGLKSNDVQLVEPATLPDSTFHPHRTRSLFTSLLLGLCAGIGAAFLAELADRSIKVAEDVTNHLGLPVLGVIPNLEIPGNGAPGPPTRRTGGGVRSLPVLELGEQLGHQALAWEAYRSLRTSILLSHSGQPPQTILVSSAVPGEGKTTTAANTAVALAQTGSRTLVMDLDLRRPCLGREFGFDEQQGMSTFLTGNSNLTWQIRETEYANLFLVPAGPPAPNPVELLGSERMSKGLELVKEFFDYVVIDAPPCGHFSDALVLSPLVDGVILVVRAGKTPREATRKIAQSLFNVGARLLGVLVNGGEVDHLFYGSYQRYYDYYHHADRGDGATRSESGSLPR